MNTGVGTAAKPRDTPSFRSSPVGWCSSVVRSPGCSGSGYRFLLVDSEGGEGSGGDVAPSGEDHFDVDLDEKCSDEADGRCAVGEDLRDVGAPFQFSGQSSIGLFDQISASVRQARVGGRRRVDG